MQKVGLGTEARRNNEVDNGSEIQEENESNSEFPAVRTEETFSIVTGNMKEELKEDKSHEERELLILQQ